MIVSTSTYAQIKHHLIRYAPDIERRLNEAISGHQGRALRKGTVRHWPALYFARLSYDHNTYTACIGYRTRADFRKGNSYVGICVEYETDQGKQLAVLNRKNDFISFITIISHHAIMRVRERLGWQDIDWYTLVQRINVMLDGACLSDIHKGGDLDEVSYTCQKGEFCGRNMDRDTILIRTFIGNDQMCEWRDHRHTRNREWFSKNLPLIRTIDPINYRCLSTP